MPTTPPRSQPLGPMAVAAALSGGRGRDRRPRAGGVRRRPRGRIGERPRRGRRRRPGRALVRTRRPGARVREALADAGVLDGRPARPRRLPARARRGGRRGAGRALGRHRCTAAARSTSTGWPTSWRRAPCSWSTSATTGVPCGARPGLGAPAAREPARGRPPAARRAHGDRLLATAAGPPPPPARCAASATATSGGSPTPACPTCSRGRSASTCSAPREPRVADGRAAARGAALGGRRRARARPAGRAAGGRRGRRRSATHPDPCRRRGAAWPGSRPGSGRRPGRASPARVAVERVIVTAVIAWAAALDAAVAGVALHDGGVSWSPVVVGATARAYAAGSAWSLRVPARCGGAGRWRAPSPPSRGSLAQAAA